MATISGTTRATSARVNSCCAISGGSEVALPIPNPKSAMPSPALARRQQEQQRSSHLHAVAGTGDQAAVGRDRHHPAHHRTPEDRGERRAAHRQPRHALAQHRHQQREQMRQQPDLGKQPQHHAGGQRHELAVGKEPAARGRTASRRSWPGIG
ncbi:hypothetical protein, partial [Paracoccus versutus]|uniref:hypothetical protein n=1 Tax=Paracoccus versutus TaxID=34007 RepID=UPI001AA0128F